MFTWKHVLRRSIVWFLRGSWIASRCDILKIGFFTYDGVGVVIRSAERNDLVKIKPTESNTAFDAMETEDSDWQAEDCTGRAWELALRLAGPSASACDSDNPDFTRSKMSESQAESDENQTVLILMTSIQSSLWLCLRLLFSVFTTSESLLRIWLDSVAGENQSQRIKEGLHLQWWCKAGFVVIWPSEEYTNAVQYCFRPRMTWICFH